MDALRWVQIKKRHWFRSRSFHSRRIVAATLHAAVAGLGRIIALVFSGSAKLQHVNQASQAASSAFEEVTGQNLLGSGAILDVDGQALAQENLELAAELVGIFEGRRAIGGDQEKCFERLLIEVRGFGLDHLDGHDAEGPHVDFAAVLFLLDDFGRHPIGCTNHSSTLGLLVGELGAETKVGWKTIVTMKQWVRGYQKTH